MVIYNQGLERVAESLKLVLNQGQWGSGTTSPTITDTGLETPIASTQLPTNNTRVNNTVQITHEVNTVTANGEELTEYEIQFGSDDVGMGRTLKGPITKTDDIQVTTIATYNILRG
jgi:hypothetical protein